MLLSAPLSPELPYRLGEAFHGRARGKLAMSADLPMGALCLKFSYFLLLWIADVQKVIFSLWVEGGLQAFTDYRFIFTPPRFVLNVKSLSW